LLLLKALICIICEITFDVIPDLLCYAFCPIMRQEFLKLLLDHLLSLNPLGVIKRVHVYTGIYLLISHLSEPFITETDKCCRRNRCDEHWVLLGL